MYDTTTDRMLTVFEAAEFLKLNDQTVRRQCREGILPAINVGRRGYRIAESDLSEYLAARKQPKAA